MCDFQGKVSVALVVSQIPFGSVGLFLAGTKGPVIWALLWPSGMQKKILPSKKQGHKGCLRIH
jgi:hypothetical protein